MENNSDCEGQRFLKLNYDQSLSTRDMVLDNSCDPDVNFLISIFKT